MLFCQLGQAHSLREISGGLRSCEGKLKHLGITAPNRSTLAYANQHRPWELYQKVFFQLLHLCQKQMQGRKKFRFKNKRMSMDSSIIDLSVALFDWAKFRRAKGAIKLHLVLDHDGICPPLSRSPKARWLISKWRLNFGLLPGPSSWMLGAIPPMSFGADGPPKESILSPGLSILAGRNRFLP